MLNATRTPTGKKAEILVVDDEPANLQLLAGILNSYGHKVRVAANGEMALRSMCFTPPPNWSFWTCVCRTWMDMKYAAG